MNFSCRDSTLLPLFAIGLLNTLQGVLNFLHHQPALLMLAYQVKGVLFVHYQFLPQICSSAGLVWVLAYLPSLPSNSAPLLVVLLLVLGLRLASLACVNTSRLDSQQRSETSREAAETESKDVATEWGWYNVDEEKYEQAWGSGISVVI